MRSQHQTHQDRQLVMTDDTSSRSLPPVAFPQESPSGIRCLQIAVLKNNQGGIITSCLQWAASVLGLFFFFNFTFSVWVWNVLSSCTSWNQSTFSSCSKGEFRDDDKNTKLRERSPEKAETALLALCHFSTASLKCCKTIFNLCLIFRI